MCAGPGFAATAFEGFHGRETGHVRLLQYPNFAFWCMKNPALPEVPCPESAAGMAGSGFGGPEKAESPRWEMEDAFSLSPPLCSEPP